MTNPRNKGRSKYKTPLARYMQEVGLSDGELANEVGCDRRTIINVKIGGMGYNTATLKKIADATGLPVEQLI